MPVLVPLQNTKSKPAPIDAMMLNQSFVIDLHHFDKIHLFALGSGARILPDDFPAIRKITGAVMLPNPWLSLRQYFKERAQFTVALADPSLRAEEVGNKGAFENAIRRVKGQQRFDVAL